MPITTNKPVNFISFSIFLLFIMGICLCISPDIAYANSRVIPVNLPEPTVFSNSGWIAVSDGFNVELYYLYYFTDTTLSDVGEADIYTRIYSRNVNNYTLSFTTETVLAEVYKYYCFKWTSSGEQFSTYYSGTMVDIPGANAILQLGVKPTYLAIGGNVVYDASFSTSTFVPAFNGGFDESMYYALTYLADDFSEILLGYVDSMNSDLALVRRYLSNLDEELAEFDLSGSVTGIEEDLYELLAYIGAEDGIFSGVQSIDSSLNTIKGYLDAVRLDVDTIRQQTKTNLDAILAESVETNDSLFALRSNMGLLVRDVADIGDEIIQVNEYLSVLLSDTGQLNVQFTSFRNDFSILSDRLLEFVDDIEAETEIWEDSKTEYKYDQVDDYSVSAFGKLWDWLINPFMSLFASSNGEISYDVESLDSGSLITQQLSVGQYFQDVMFNPDIVDPSYSDLGDINLGGLP